MEKEELKKIQQDIAEIKNRVRLLEEILLPLSEKKPDKLAGHLIKNNPI